MHTNFWSSSLKGSDHSEDLGVDAKIILEWILEKYKISCGLDASIYFRIETSVGLLWIR
jgi:hypothetical protein